MLAVQMGRTIHTLLGVNLAHISCLQLILAQLGLFLHPLLIALGKADELLHLVHVVLAFLVEIVHLEGLGPHMLVQIHQHVLLQPRLPIVDRDAVVVAVETVDESLDRGFVQVAQVRGCLPWFLAHHDRLGLNETESINDNLALHRLDRVDDNGHGTRGELLKGLLGVDVDGRKPAAETRM